jgi:hypothetical protein
MSYSGKNLPHHHVHCGFASRDGAFIAHQLRTRFCLPVKVSAALELAARVSKFSPNRDSIADILVAATSLRAAIVDVDDSLSGSKVVDELRKNACIISRESCLDTVSQASTDLVMNDVFTSDLLDKVIISTAVLLSLGTSDTEAAVISAVRQGVHRTSALVSKYTRSTAHQSVLSDISASVQDEIGDPATQIVDLHTKQAQIELRSCSSLCEIIYGLLRKQPCFDSMLEQFTELALDGTWYSSLALNQDARSNLFRAQGIVKRAGIPFQLIEKLLKLLAQRVKKIAAISFDDCTLQLWSFITQFVTLRDDLLKDFVGFQKLLEGTSGVLREISCSASATSWLSRYAVVQEQMLQEAIVADELHSLVEVSYQSSRVYLWLTDFIATIEILPKLQFAVTSSDSQGLLLLSHERFWEVLMVFVGKALMEILNLCTKELQQSSSDNFALQSSGLTGLVNTLGSGLNNAINFVNFTATDGEKQKGVFANIKQAAADTVRAVRQGKGVISAAAAATKGTVKTAFSVVTTTANAAVQVTAAVAQGVDAAASSVATGAARVAGLGTGPKLVQDSSFAASGGSVFFTISLIRAVEEAIRNGVSASQSLLKEMCNCYADIESAIEINFKKQHILPLCVNVCSQSSTFFQQTFCSVVEGVLNGKNEATSSWEYAVVNGVNAIAVHVPDSNPDPILQSAAQDLFKCFVQVVLGEFCVAVARCKRESGARFNEAVALELLQQSGDKLAQALNDFSRNDFNGCASEDISDFRERFADVLNMQFSLKQEDLLKMLQESQIDHNKSLNFTKDIITVMQSRFKSDAKIQSLLNSLKDRKWRSAFSIPESDVFVFDAAASIQDINDPNMRISGMLYITHHHICFLEDLESSKHRATSQKQIAVSLGPVHVPASTARFRIQWARDNSTVTHKDTKKIKIKGSIDALLYQNACVLSRFRMINPEANSKTYIKCILGKDQQ